MNTNDNFLDPNNLPPRIEPKSNNYKDLTNQRFGKLTALYPCGYLTADNRLAWCCKCDCGNYKMILGKNLLRGHTLSCGCSQNKKGGSQAKTESNENSAAKGTEQILNKISLPKVHQLNFTNKYNLVFYVDENFRFYDKMYIDTPIAYFVNCGIYDSELNDVNADTYYINKYTLTFQNYMLIDNVPFSDFTKTEEYTFTKKERDEIDAYPANDGWKQPFIDRHVTYSLGEEEIDRIRNIKISEMTNDFINELIEKKLYVPVTSIKEDIDLTRKLKTKYFLNKVKMNSCRITTELSIPASRVFTSWQEAYDYAAMMYAIYKTNSARQRQLDIKEGQEDVINYVAEEDREEMRIRLSLLAYDNDFDTFLCLQNQVFYKTFSGHCYQLYPFDKSFISMSYTDYLNTYVSNNKEERAEEE